MSQLEPVQWYVKKKVPRWNATRWWISTEQVLLWWRVCVVHFYGVISVISEYLLRIGVSYKDVRISLQDKDEKCWCERCRWFRSNGLVQQLRSFCWSYGPSNFLSLLEQRSKGVMDSCRNTILYLLSRSAPPGLQGAALGSISHCCIQHIDVVAHISIVAVAVAVALSRLFWCWFWWQTGS